MRRAIRFMTTLAVVAGLSTVPLLAQRGGGGGGHAGGLGAGAGAGAGHGPEMGSGGPNMGRGGMARGDRGTNATTLGHQKNAGELLTQNTKLASRLGSLLPAGTNLQQASAGFKNLGQFVAAVHVAHNLGISFDDLKARMTGSNSESLGKAIHDLKPEANSKAEAKRAKRQAEDSLREAESGA